MIIIEGMGIAMTDFKGITLEYRATDEFKGWMKAIMDEHPGLPPYIAEMAIAYHKRFPHAHREQYLSKGKGKANKGKQLAEAHSHEPLATHEVQTEGDKYVIMGAVQVLDAPIEV